MREINGIVMDCGDRSDIDKHLEIIASVFIGKDEELWRRFLDTAVRLSRLMNELQFTEYSEYEGLSYVYNKAVECLGEALIVKLLHAMLEPSLDPALDKREINNSIQSLIRFFVKIVSDLNGKRRCIRWA
jgi:hypothetical protein